jgi:hypothetical protein
MGRQRPRFLGRQRSLDQWAFMRRHEYSPPSKLPQPKRFKWQTSRFAFPSWEFCSTTYQAIRLNLLPDAVAAGSRYHGVHVRTRQF